MDVRSREQTRRALELILLVYDCPWVLGELLRVAEQPTDVTSLLKRGDLIETEDGMVGVSAQGRRRLYSEEAHAAGFLTVGA